MNKKATKSSGDVPNDSTEESDDDDADDDVESEEI